MVDVIEEMVAGLVEHVQRATAWAHVGSHYKLEEWIAVEAFSFFSAQPTWYPAAVAPYVTSERPGK